MSTRTDIHHGRQGGNWLPDDYEAFDVAELPRCEVCRHPMIANGRHRHFMCDTASIVGRACICAPGCTVAHVGDQGSCDPGCEVCTLMRGQLYADVPGWKKTRKADDQGDELVEVAPSLLDAAP